MFILYLLYNYIVCVQPPEPVSVFKIWSMGQVKHTRGMLHWYPLFQAILCCMDCGHTLWSLLIFGAVGSTIRLAAAALGQRQLHIVLLELAVGNAAGSSKVVIRFEVSTGHVWPDQGTDLMPGTSQLQFCSSDYSRTPYPYPYLLYLLLRWAMGLAIPG